VGSIRLCQKYFIHFINPFPGCDIPQTFIAHTSDVTTIHDDIDNVFQCPMRFISLVFYIKCTQCSISWNPPTTIHRFVQNRPTIIIVFLVYSPSIIFLLLQSHHPCIIHKIATRYTHIVITRIGLI